MVRIEKGSLAQEVMQQIMNYINAGRFPSGSKLPSSDELAQMFGVGRSSVREALKELQTLGIVTLKHGDGTYVCNFSSQKELGPMSYICEVRRMIEVYCADTGVERASEEDLRELGEWLHFMEKHFNDDKLFIYYDRRFHFKISEITRNPVIMSILKSMAPTPVRPSGGVYFVPAQHTDRLEAMLRFVKLLDHGEGEKVPLIDTTDMRNLVTRKLLDHLRETLRACEEGVSNQLPKGQMKEILEHARQVAQDYVQYKAIITGDLKEMEELVAGIREKVSAALINMAV